MSPPALEILALSGEVQGRRWPLSGPRTTVGRGDECDVVLPLSAVSRLHAEVLLEGERVIVRDLGSHNGVRVDGRRVAEAELPPGGVFSIGGVRLQVVAPGEALPAVAGAAPPAAPGAAVPERVLAPDELFRRAPPPAEPGDETPVAPPRPRPLAVPPWLGRAAAAAGFGLVVLVAILGLRSLSGGEPVVQDTVVAVDEERAVRWRGPLGSSVRVDRPDVASVEPWKGVRWILIVRGKSTGEGSDIARAEFRAGGRTVGVVRVRVRGRKPPAFDRADFSAWDPARREQEARDLVTGGIALLGHRPFEAWRAFEKAAFLVKEDRPRPGIHGEAIEYSRKAAQEIDRRMKPLETKVQETLRTKDWIAFREACDAGRTLVPDPGDVRYQVFDVLGRWADERRRALAPEGTP